MRAANMGALEWWHYVVVGIVAKMLQVTVFVIVIRMLPAWSIFMSVIALALIGRELRYWVRTWALAIARMA